MWPLRFVLSILIVLMEMKNSTKDQSVMKVPSVTTRQSTQHGHISFAPSSHLTHPLVQMLNPCTRMLSLLVSTRRPPSPVPTRRPPSPVSTSMPLSPAPTSTQPSPVSDLFQQGCILVISKLSSSRPRDVHNVSMCGHQDNSERVLQLASKC